MTQGSPRRVRLVVVPAALALLALAGEAGAALRVAVISDLNGSYGSTSYEPAVAHTVRQLIRLAPDLVISTGDMVAGQRQRPQLRRDEIEAMWSAFHDLVTTPLREAGIPFAMTPGNHDASGYEQFALERKIYREQWLERRDGLEFVDATHFPFRYAFVQGGVLFVALDATMVGPLDRAQRDWLEGLLGASGRYSHRVVFSHLPVFPFATGRADEVLADHDLESVLLEHDVDIYLSGHHHAFYPGRSGTVRHVSQACLGAAPRSLIGTTQRSERAVTWLDFAAEEVAIEALIAPSLERTISRQTLPARIRSEFGILVRDDLAASADRGGIGISALR